MNKSIAEDGDMERAKDEYFLSDGIPQNRNAYKSCRIFFRYSYYRLQFYFKPRICYKHKFYYKYDFFA